MFEEVDLEHLNEKQKAKEFKSVAKDIKSKDPDVKSKALLKIKNPKYLVEGGCLIPLFESIIIKKKHLEISKLGIDAINHFLSTAENSIVISALRTMQSMQENLDCILNIFGFINYQEEVKKPPSAKQNQTHPIESEVVLSLRSESIRTLFLISKALTFSSSSQSSVVSISRAFSSLPNFVSILFTKISDVVEKRSSEENSRKEAAHREGIEALSVLLFVLKYSESAVNELLNNNNDHEEVLKLLTLASDRAYRLPCMEVCELIRKQASFLSIFSRESHLFGLLEALEDTADMALQLPGATLATFRYRDQNEKEKGGKKVEEKKVPQPATGAGKDKKVPKEVQSAAAIAAAAEIPKTLTITLNCLSKILTQIFATHLSIPLGAPPLLEALPSVPFVSRLIAALGKVCGNMMIWETSRSLSLQPEFETRCDTLEHCGVLIGLAALLSPLSRETVRAAGGGWFLLTGLQYSTQIYSAGSSLPLRNSQFIAPNFKDLHRFRFIFEKSFLCLVTSDIGQQVSSPSSPIPANGITLIRWPIAEAHNIDTTCFTPTSEPPSNNGPGVGSGTISTRALIELAISDDPDLAGRALRLLSLVVLGCHFDTQASLLSFLSVDITVINRLSAILQEKANNFLSSSNDYSADITGGKGGFNSFDLQSSSHDSASSCDPSTLSSIYLSCVLLELFVKANEVFINAFANKDRLSILSEMLYQCGPTALIPTCPEVMVSLFDPRMQCWGLPSADVGLSPTENLAPISEETRLREPILALLSNVASADASFMTVNGPVPPEPTVPLPQITSPCAEASASVCRYCGDACLSIVLTVVKIQLQDALQPLPAQFTEKSFVFSSGDLNRLNINILNSCLVLLNAMASCRTLGLLCMLESISDAGFKSVDAIPVGKVGAGGGGGGGGTAVSSPRISERRGSIQFLKSIFSHLIKENEDSTSLSTNLNSPFEWNRPSFYSDLFKSPINPCNFSSLIASKALWPLFLLTGCFSGLLSNPQLLGRTSSLCLQTLTRLFLIPELSPHSQPVIVDAFATIFLGLGGGPILCRALGRYGVIDEEIKSGELGEPLLEYLFSRGRHRQNFWAKWKNDHEERDPKTGKVIKKKPLTTAPKSETKKSSNSVNMEVRLNFEPDEDFPDPNHGPSEDMWVGLINVPFLDFDTNTNSTTLLSALNASLQGQMFNLSNFLIDHGSDVNFSDSEGFTPLMFALVLGNEAVLTSLLQKKADLNTVDRNGNPGIKYAFCSLSAGDIEYKLSPHSDLSFSIFIGYSRFLELVLTLSDPDVRMCDALGNSSFLYLMGIGNIDFRLGNHRFNIQCSVPDQPIDLARLLLQKNASLNQCNRSGVVPLHIAAARGDIQALQFFLDSDANPTLLDCQGMLPIHYLVTACPTNQFDAEHKVGGFTTSPLLAIECFDLLLKASEHHAISQTEFVDNRSGKTPIEKYMFEVDEILEKMFNDILHPQPLQLVRATPYELHTLTTQEGLNLLHLSLSGHTIFDNSSVFFPLICTNKFARIHLSLHILKSLGEGTGLTLINQVDSYGTSVLHCASLLLLDNISRLPLTEKELRAKRVRHFPSIEVQLLDTLFEKIDPKKITTVSTRTIHHSRNSFPPSWSVLHGAIASNNEQLIRKCLQFGIKIYSFPFIHYLSSCDPKTMNPETIENLIKVASSSPVHGSLLNATFKSPVMFLPPPIFMAAKLFNPTLIRLLIQSQRVDLNVQEKSENRRTALHVACLKRSAESLRDGDLPALQLHFQQIRTIRAFGSSKEGTEELNLLLEDADGRTCIDEALVSGVDPHICRETMLSELISLAPDQVLERALSPQEEGKDSWLLKLEQRDQSLTEQFYQMLKANDTKLIRKSPRPSPRGPSYNTNEIENIEREIRSNASLLRPLLSLLSDSTEVSTFSHVHTCYSQQLLFQEFLQSTSS